MCILIYSLDHTQTEGAYAASQKQNSKSLLCSKAFRV